MLLQLATLKFVAQHVACEVLIRATKLCNLQSNNVARQVARKCCPYYLAFTERHIFSERFHCFIVDFPIVGLFKNCIAIVCIYYYIYYHKRSSNCLMILSFITIVCYGQNFSKNTLLALLIFKTSFALIVSNWVTFLLKVFTISWLLLNCLILWKTYRCRLDSLSHLSSWT